MSGAKKEPRAFLNGKPVASEVWVVFADYGDEFLHLADACESKAHAKLAMDDHLAEERPAIVMGPYALTSVPKAKAKRKKQ